MSCANQVYVCGKNTVTASQHSEDNMCMSCPGPVNFSCTDGAYVLSGLLFTGDDLYRGICRIILGRTLCTKEGV